jgi:DNA-binding LacI/PurR family transcriptional regulator
MRVTIRDVARKARASTSAVSAVLSGRQSTIRVAEATRQRILKAAESLGYQPHPIAQSLASKRTGVLGLVFPYAGAFTDNNPFNAAIMAGTMAAATERRYNLMLHTKLDAEWSAMEARMLLDPRVDGIVLVEPWVGIPLLRDLLAADKPFVAIHCEIPCERLYCVNADDVGGARIAVEHLIRLGHERIAHLIGGRHSVTALRRLEGYQIALKENGIKPCSALMVECGFDERQGYAATQQVLRLRRPPTAIFVSHDIAAIGAFKAIKAAGLRVPEDIAVVGYGDSGVAATLQPPLTTVRLPIYDMALTATRMLVELVEGREPAPRQVVMPVTLVVRESCGATQSSSAGRASLPAP